MNKQQRLPFCGYILVAYAQHTSNYYGGRCLSIPVFTYCSTLVAHCVIKTVSENLHCVGQTQLTSLPVHFCWMSGPEGLRQSRGLKARWDVINTRENNGAVDARTSLLRQHNIQLKPMPAHSCTVHAVRGITPPQQSLRTRVRSWASR